MAKKQEVNKQPTQEELEKAFEMWDLNMDRLILKAEQSQMSLLADVFKLGKSVLKIYKGAFLHLLENQKNK
jgi:hypothetical protein